MFSDPTGYFSLVEVTAAMSINSTLEESYNNAILSGFINFMDAYLGGERDPYRLLSIFGNGFCDSLIPSAKMGFLSMISNMACSMPVAAMTAKISLAIIDGLDFVSSVQGMCQSFAEEKREQGWFRAILTAKSGYSFYQSWGSAVNTARDINNGTTCFVAGTNVLTEDGEKPIEEIEVGDFVYSTDPETGESEYKEVLQTFVNETSELVHIHVNDDEIVSTPTHPFYSPVRGWTSAFNLRAGDILVLSNGEYVVVEQVQHEILEAPVKVYNFEIQDFHTYYVGKNSVLVHNECYKAGEHDYEYTTDENGNIIYVHADELFFKVHDGRLNHNKNTPGKLVGDDAGHLIADQFGGSPYLNNLVSQNSKLNRGEKGKFTYRSMETQWANALNNHKRVTDINIYLTYNNGSSRPSTFRVSYNIGDEHYYQHYYHKFYNY